MTYKALVIVIPITAPRPEDKHEYDSLEEFVEYGQRVADGLESLGYSVSYPVIDTWKWTASHINNIFQDFIRSSSRDDVCVIHILSHAELAKGPTTIMPVGADGQTDSLARIDEWLTQLQLDAKVRPLTLIIADTCFSGVAARTPWQATIKPRDLRGWVLAASEPDRSAYKARLSLAIAEQLRAVADNTMNISGDIPFVPWETFRNKVIEHVARAHLGNRLDHEDDEIDQRVTSILLDAPAPELPFYPNPAYQPPGPVQLAKNLADPALVPILDSVTEEPTYEHQFVGMDPGHFTKRAKGIGRTSTFGSFTGRRMQLEALSDWIDVPRNDDSIRAVLGNPGAGKSALLGILVCAAHPLLREATASIWSMAAKNSRVPNLHSNIVAIHTRSMSVSQILTSIGRQLDLSKPWDGWTIRDITAALATRPLPLIVLDSIDESQSVEETNDLLTHLSNGRRFDGSPLCRLIVGIRSGKEWPLLNAWIMSLSPAQRIDLNEISPEVIRGDIRQYLSSAFGEKEKNKQFIIDITEKLTESSGQSSEWGHFLVASLVAAYALHNNILDSRRASDALLSDVPKTLPEVLRLDLAVGDHKDLRRAILACLSWAKGSGMPLRIVRFLVRDVFGINVNASDKEFNDAFELVRFYLRTTTDTNGEVLWRLFHQGLADHLHLFSIEVAQSIWSSILRDRPSDSSGLRMWDTAEPYLCRHGLEHAMDAAKTLSILGDSEYLVNADPGYLSDLLDRLLQQAKATLGKESHAEKVISAVYRQSFYRHHKLDNFSRRQILQIDQARFGTRTAISTLHLVPSNMGGIWSVDWATGSMVDTQLRATMQTGPAHAVACIDRSQQRVVETAPSVVIGSLDGSLQLWDLETQSRLRASKPNKSGGILALACSSLAEGKPVAVTASQDKFVKLWDLSSPEVSFIRLGGHAAQVTAVSCTTIPGVGPVAVTGSKDGELRIWDLTNRRLLRKSGLNIQMPIVALECVVVPNFGPMAITSHGGHSLKRWNLTDRHLLARRFVGNAGKVIAISQSFLPRTGSVIVTGSQGGELGLWDPKNLRLVGAPIHGHGHAVLAIECINLTGIGPVAITGSAGRTVRILDLEKRRFVGDALRGHTNPILDVACTPLPGGRQLAISSSTDDLVRVWELRKPNSLVALKRGHSAPVLSMASTVLPDGVVITVTGGADKKAYIWNMSVPAAPRQTFRAGVDVVLAIQCLTLSGVGPVAVLGCRDGFLRIMNLTTRHTILQSRRTESGRDLPRRPNQRKPKRRRDKVLKTRSSSAITVVACSVLPSNSLPAGRPVAVTNGKDNALYVWDLSKSPLLGKRLKGDYADMFTSAACTLLPGIGPVAVTGSDNGLLRIWSLTNNSLMSTSWQSRVDRITALGCTAECRPVSNGGNLVAVTGSPDGLVRAWVMTDRRLSWSRLGRHEGGVTGVVCPELPQIGPVAITCGNDAIIRVWDLEKLCEIPEGKFQLPDTPTTLTYEGGKLSIGMKLDIIILSFEEVGTLWSH